MNSSSCLPKHEKYCCSYTPNDFYWGIGIENETYIELGHTTKQASFIKQNHQSERYSVNYWKIYKESCAESTINKWIDTLPSKENTMISIPVLMNAHSFSSTDTYGNHKTTHEKTPQRNRYFEGKTLYDHLCETEDYFKKTKEKSWTFDGDTIEFMTQNFYKATIEDVVEELSQLKTQWMSTFKKSMAGIQREKALEGGFRFPTKNHGFAIFLTNRTNIGIFNNGTYHFNITIPTQLDDKANIKDQDLFRAQHRAAARMFQWITPFLIAKFGSPEILSCLPGQFHFPKGSQRICASRYVSAGTYDTEKMAPGKILQIENEHGKNAWYDRIYDDPAMGYTRLEKIGLDINFNKHFNHGLELRIFDEFPEKHILDVLRLIVWMCDEALFRKTVADPRKNACWNDLLARVIMDGKYAVLNAEEKKVFSYELNIPIVSENVLSVYDTLWETWCDRWNWSKNTCSERMIRSPLDRPKSLTVQNNTIGEVKKVSVEIQTDPETTPPVNTVQFEAVKTPFFKWCCIM